MKKMKYVENAKKVFLDTGTRIPREMIWAIGIVKYSAAKANKHLGLLEPQLADAIMETALELAEGKYDNLIQVDVFQTGSGTGLNMNANEVIALKATEKLGKDVHPNDHVNMGQSSNDVIPTVIRIAAVETALGQLKPSLENLIGTLRKKAEETQDAVKPGRTHLRDALPVTLGQELEAWANALEKDLDMLLKAVENVMELPLGGTAVGTGLNSHPRYAELAIGYISETTKRSYRPAKSRFRAMRSLSDLLILSSIYKAIATDLWRLSQDLRLMYSGPNTGFNEIDMPQKVPGSSIMPGKVNPVTVEAVMQASSHVMGMEQSLTNASLLGELELSMGLPLSGYLIIRQAKLLAEAMDKLSEQAIETLRPNLERMKTLAENSQALITVLSPKIGYDKAAELSKMIYEGKSVREALKAAGLSEDEIERLLDLKKLTQPGIP